MHESVEDLKIEAVDTSKNNIPQRQLMKTNVIPKHPKISVFTGPAGSGKTTLVANLLMKPQFYGPSFEGLHIPKGQEKKYQKKPVKPKPYFDHIILLIGSGDDMYDQLIEERTINQVIKNPTQANVAKIIRAQEELLEEAGGDILKTPKLLIICDDLMSNKRLLNSKPFSDLSIKNRHLNSSIWYLSQYINLVPKSIREQATNTFIFQCTAQCQKVLMEQFREPGVSKDDFESMLEHATQIEDSGKRNFLHINKAHKHKFRKNLDTYLYFGWQDEPQTISTPAKKVKKEFKEEHEVQPEEVADFPTVTPQANKAQPIRSIDPKNEEKLYKQERPAKTYLIGGRFVKFEI